MAWTTQQKVTTAIIVILVIVLAVAIWRHSAWMKKHCTCTKGGGFHGWRHQHYEDNPYNGQNYHCGLGAKGNLYFSPECCPRRDTFSGDDDGWPSAGVIGNLADTNPYGNYAGHVDMHWPTNSEGYVQDLYWTRT
jgi:hypothetical protein